MTLAILSKDNDVFGTDKYRSTDSTVPRAFRANLEHSVLPNKNGSNHQVTVKHIVPVVNTINGVTTSADSFLCIFKFAALQHITNDVERAKAFDDTLAYLTAARESILAGQLPDQPVTLT